MNWSEIWGWMFSPSAAQFGSFIGGVSTLVAVIVAGATARFAVKQLAGSLKTAQGDFLIRIWEILQLSNDIHSALVNGEISAPSKEDLHRIRRYMGLFEVIHALIESGTLDFKTVDHSFGHRLCRLVNNRLIIEKILGADGAVWLSFETLWAKMKREGTTFRQTQAQIDREANKLVASAEALQVTDLGKCKDQLAEVLLRCYQSAVRSKAESLATRLGIQIL